MLWKNKQQKKNQKKKQTNQKTKNCCVKVWCVCADIQVGWFIYWSEPEFFSVWNDTVWNTRIFALYPWKMGEERTLRYTSPGKQGETAWTSQNVIKTWCRCMFILFHSWFWLFNVITTIRLPELFTTVFPGLTFNCFLANM